MNIAIWMLGKIDRERLPLPRGNWSDWLTDSRNGVFVVLALALFVGGGRKLLQSLRARRAVDALSGDKPGLSAIAEAPKHGRAAVLDLFRLLGSSSDRAVRDAAGQALSVLWKADELIPEEEQALVTRGFVVAWSARRRYPRALDRPLPILVEFGLPFLSGDDSGIGQDCLEWSWRILGSERVSLESFSPWVPGRGRAEFTINPSDYPMNGPHRLVLQARVRTTGVTTIWQKELPQVPFTFEFDPNLSRDALFTLPDAARASEFASAIRLESNEISDREPIFLTLNEEFALRDPPSLHVLRPIPCDLAHALHLELEELNRPIAVGEVVVVATELPHSGQSVACGGNTPSKEIDRTGEYRARLVLTPDAHRAWSNPKIRSVWPESIMTDWISVRIVRR